ncbi:hypothetical protein O1Q96_24070 [Streptomyces sp. Qhu-G9]|nr:hypothetical protein [Streptomyces aurantiacus]WAU82549.1 hypothetical protein O1Q96_24070 [Streptomyces aurantiacus]
MPSFALLLPTALVALTRNRKGAGIEAAPYRPQRIAVPRHGR